MTRVYSVRELTGAIREVIESQFPFLWVRGQVTNLSRPGSGHIYFALRDEDAVLNVVWFRSSQTVHASLKPERIAQGMEVVCAGRMAVYPPRGGYQLIAELIQDEGVGRLHLELEALKRKLSALGYFDPARKRPLPARVSRVAVVTAPAGAAIRDFLCLSCNRGHAGSIRIYPARVQGEGAPSEIVSAIGRACRDGWAEVLVLIRGGGSLEDLWAFNTEAVAKAVFEATVPVVCGVGHEIDTSLADLVADVRAATPSHAAQLLWPERSVILQSMDDLELALVRAANRHLDRGERALGTLAKALIWLSPARRLQRMGERLCEHEGALGRAWIRCLERSRTTLMTAALQLARLGGPPLFREREDRLARLEKELRRLGTGIISAGQGRLDLLEARMSALDPKGPLGRGYALVRLSDGSCLRDPGQVRPGDALDIEVSRGKVQAEVVSGEPDAERG